jgi:hypothetical protein
MHVFIKENKEWVVSQKLLSQEKSLQEYKRRTNDISVHGIHMWQLL